MKQAQQPSSTATIFQVIAFGIQRQFIIVIAIIMVM